MAQAGEADAEVGVFCDVEGVPAAGVDQGFAHEVVRGAAQGNGEAQALKGWKQRIEERGILDCELAGERHCVAKAPNMMMCASFKTDKKEPEVIGRIEIHPHQIRWYAQSALNAFKDLERDDAIESAKADLRRLLSYLDALDTANEVVLVSGIEGVKPGIRGELVFREPD